ncbi:hypothetical protein B484DRAFT_200045 [Ochromonadaceae sp. CCMP2298]|nr:hypothetical protein B484DRAFT_200045 [Ochromonadaceae sp. CCMP2298]
MLSQKIATVHHAVYATLGSQSEVLEMMQSAMDHSPRNFQFVIVECMPDKPDNDGLQTLALIRAMGFRGRLIATTHCQEDISTQLVNCRAADCLVRYPISIREITKMLAEDVEEVHKMVHTTSGRLDLTQDDLAEAITSHVSSDALQVDRRLHRDSYTPEYETQHSSSRSAADASAMDDIFVPFGMERSEPLSGDFGSSAGPSGVACQSGLEWGSSRGDSSLSLRSGRGDSGLGLDLSVLRADSGLGDSGGQLERLDEGEALLTDRTGETEGTGGTGVTGDSGSGSGEEPQSPKVAEDLHLDFQQPQNNQSSIDLMSGMDNEKKSKR